MSDIHPFPTPEQRRAMEKRCRWLQKSRKILERRLAFYVRTYNQVEFDDPLGRREAMGELLNNDPSLRIPALSGLVFHGTTPLWNQFDIAVVMDRNQSNISRTLKEIKDGDKYPEDWKRRLAECTHEADGKTAGYDERVFALLLDCQEEDYLQRLLSPRRGSGPRTPEEAARIRRYWEEEKRRAEADIDRSGLTDRDVWGLHPNTEDRTDTELPSLKDAFMELLRGMARWKGAWAIATLFSIYTELSTFFHNLYAWFPLISLAVVVLCVLLLRRRASGTSLWRSVGSTALLILSIWTVCFVGRGFSVENPSLLTRLPLMEKLQEGIAKLEGIEARRSAQTKALLEEALNVTDAFLLERRGNDTPVSDTEYQQMLRRTEVREVPEPLWSLRCALRVNEARIYLDWAVDDYRSGLTKLRTAERLLLQSRAELEAPDRRSPEGDELRGRIASVFASVLFAGLERGLWEGRADEAIRAAEEAAALFRDRRPLEAIAALETRSHLYCFRAGLAIDPDSGDLRRAEAAAEEGLVLSSRNENFLHPALSLALGLAMAAGDRNEEAVRAFRDGIRHTDMQFQPNLYVALSAALAESCAAMHLEREDPDSRMEAEEALSAAIGVLNRHAHMTSDAFLQFALARASMAVGLATGSRQELDRALDAVDRVLEIWTFTPYTSNHIQATYTKALILTSSALIPQKHEDFGKLEKEGSEMDSPLGDLVRNAAREARRRRTLMDRATGMKALQKAVEILEKIAYYDRTNPTLSQKCAADLFNAYMVLAESHAVAGAMRTLHGEPGGGDHYAASAKAIGRAREVAGGQGADRILRAEKFLRESRLKAGVAEMLMSLTGKSSEDLIGDR
ncbi:MAG: hypothetical protein Q4A13_05805 [Fretibacterium sp.]|nr:hypothetical protein [Fretibacterium sp.]